MKTRTINLISAIGLLTGLAAQASTNYPVLRPENCSVNVTVPEGSNAQYYLSKDCKTAFILPNEMGTLSVARMSFGPGVREYDCDRALNIGPRVEKMEGLLKDLREEVKLTQKQRHEEVAKATTASDKQVIAAIYDGFIVDLEKTIKEYEADLQSLLRREPYSSFEGASVQMDMVLDTAHEVRKYAEVNQSLGINFKAARIDTGILSFAIGKDVEAEYPSVLGAVIPGLSASGQDQFSVSRNMIANGGAAGLLVLSQPAVCELISNLRKSDGQDLPFHRNLLQPENLSNAGFVANYIYDVPVTSEVKFSFKAEVLPRDLVAAWEGMVTKIDNRNEVSSTDFSRLLTDGALSSTIKIKYGDGGEPFNVARAMNAADERLNLENGHIFTILFGSAMDTYMELLVEKLKALNLMKERVNTELVAVSAKEVEERNVVRDCRWTTNWYGKSKRKCSNRTVVTRYFVPGVSKGTAVEQDNVAISLDWEVEAQNTLSMRHTSGFTTK